LKRKFSITTSRKPLNRKLAILSLVFGGHLERPFKTPFHSFQLQQYAHFLQIAAESFNMHQLLAVKPEPSRLYTPNR
jgi:hypothetical protein